MSESLGKEIYMKRLSMTVLLALALCMGLFAAPATDMSVDELMEQVNYYKAVAEAGDMAAYETEYGYLKVAAEKGSAQAMLWIGELYQGNFIEDAHNDPDPVATAIEWWEKAAENGLQRAYFNIGMLHLHRPVPGGGPAYGNVEYDEEKAFDYFWRAAQAKDSKSVRYVALCYQEGLGVEKDEAKAFEYFYLGTLWGDNASTMYIADAMMYGIGCEQNTNAAMMVYQEMIDIGAHQTGSCALRLGKIYMDGIYVEQDLDKAAEYFTIAKGVTKTDSTNTVANIHAVAEAALKELGR